MNKRAVGAAYEDKAAIFLEKNGLKILERNFRSRQGEIDVIAQDGECLVFVEVKYRTTQRHGAPIEAVTYAKQKNICKVADFYRMLHGIGEFSPIRYDVIGICEEEIKWYQNAFYHISR